MPPRDSEDVERREVSCFAPRFHIELRADAPNEFRPVAFRGKHPAQKKQIARLHRFHIGAERLRGRREVNAKFFQPPFGVGWPSVFEGYWLRFRIYVHLSLSCPIEIDVAVRGVEIRAHSVCPYSHSQLAQ
jgi:hypothetical protein